MRVVFILSLVYFLGGQPAQGSSIREDDASVALVQSLIRQEKNEQNAKLDRLVRGDKTDDATKLVKEKKDDLLKEKVKESMVLVIDGVEKHNTDVHPQIPADENNNNGRGHSDIIVPKSKTGPKTGRGKRQAQFAPGSSALWANGVVPFIIVTRPNFTEWTDEVKNWIRGAFQLWENVTCVRFIEYASEADINQAGLTQYLNVGEGIGCSSGVGAGNPAYMNLGTGCTDPFVVMHEAGHALGLQHVQCRDDRDQYITVHYDNIVEGSIGNYGKMDTHNLVPYDLQSTMHYDPWSNSKNGYQTMTSDFERLGFLMGSRGVLTFYDAQLVNTLYQCTTHCTTTCHNTGYPGPDCNCKCPDLITGETCDQLSPTGVSMFDPSCKDGRDDCSAPENEGGCDPGHYNHVYVIFFCHKLCGFCSDEAPDPACHETIHLDNGESKPISSLSDKRGKCLWFIKANNGYRIRLTLSEFEIAYENATGNCWHWLEVRYNLVSQQGPKFCGSGWTDGHIETTPGGDVTYMVLRYNSIDSRGTLLQGFTGTVQSVKLADCGSPAVNNGTVTGTDFFHGHHVTIACDPGYIHASGDLERYCFGNGTWSGESPVCIVNLCLAKTDIEPEASCSQWINGGKCKPEDPDTVWINANCARGCCEEALLAGEVKVCEKPYVANGTVSGTDFVTGGKIIISCNASQGMLLFSGSTERVCQANGTWSGTDAVCKVNLCVAKTNIEPEASCSQWVDGGKCKPEDPDTVWINANCARACCEEAFLAGEVKVCEKPYVANGTVSGTDFVTGGKITISCNASQGMLLYSGSTERVCQANGTWSGTDAVCIVNTCLDQTNIQPEASCSQWVNGGKCEPEDPDTVWINANCARGCCEEALRAG